MNKALLAALLLGFSSAAMAQSAPQATGQSVTQPSPNLATPQTQMNDNQQPANARRSGNGQAIGQQVTQPIPNQATPQTETTNNQQPPNVRRTR